MTRQNILNLQNQTATRHGNRHNVSGIQIGVRFVRGQLRAIISSLFRGISASR